MSDSNQDDYRPRHSQLDPTVTPTVSSNVYDTLKQGAQIILPAVLTLYLALSTAWDWPNQDQISITIGAVNVFIGVVVGYLSATYKKSDARFDGVVEISENADGLKRADLILKNYVDPADVVNQDEVTFKVKSS